MMIDILHRLTIVTVLVTLGIWPIDSEAKNPKLPMDEETFTRVLNTSCVLLRDEIANGDKNLSKGFDYARALAQNEPWAKHPFLMRTGIVDAPECIKSILLQGEALSHLERELGIVRSKNMPKPGSLHHKAALTAGSVWPVMAVVEMIGLSHGWQAMARSAKQSIARGVAGLIRRNATIECIKRFVQNLTYGMAALDLAGNAEDKKQTLTNFIRSNDGGIDVMMEQCLSGVPELCLPTCGPRRSK